MKTAIVWMTSFDDPKIDEACERLRFEAAPYGEVFHLRHPAGPDDAVRFESHGIALEDQDLEAVLPRRYGAMLKTGVAIYMGFMDLALMAVMHRLASFDYVWLLEYDVDFSGHWATFFSSFETCRADLLTTTVYPRSLSRGWCHWTWFAAPPGTDPRAQARAFLPVTRLSRRFVEVYREEEGRGWTGHYEALFPTIAFQRGLKVEDIGGTGPLTPVIRRGLFYSGTDDPALEQGTFRFRPPVAGDYHHRVPRSPPNHLWHPVKTPAYFALGRP